MINMLIVSLPTVLGILLSGSVSAFAPPATLVGGQHRIVPGQGCSGLITTSQLAAAASSVASVAKPAAEASVFFQKRIAEPANVESVPSAAYLLSEEFPQDPFVIEYRTTNIYNSVGETRPMLDLSVLKQIEIDDNETIVKVEAGVTVGNLAMKLQKLSSSSNLKELFRALPASGLMTIAEAVLDERFEKMKNVVQEVHAVDKDGNINSKQLSDINVQEDIIVNIVLSPAAATKPESGIIGRWYSRKSLDTPLPDGFVSNLPDNVEIVVHKHGLFNQIPNVVVFVDGDSDLGLPVDEWNQVLVESPEELWNLQNDLSDRAGLDALTASGVLDVSSLDLSFQDVLSVFEAREENLYLVVGKDKIRAVFDVRYPPDVDDATKELFTFDKKVGTTIAPAAQEKPLLSKRVAKTLPTVTCGTVIEGFKGEIYDGVRGQMQEKRFQYASSSYDNMMNPSLIVYPVDAEDVAVAIRYATLPEYTEARKTLANPSGYPYKVMGRGGGHQYCGVSCDNDAFIISMDNFKKIEKKDVNLEGVTGPDGEPHTVTLEVHVGTGVRLKDFATAMNTDATTGQPAKGKNGSFGATIPHGECPTVGIGGHSQTGGYGHIARAFGLAIDYVYGFTIVTADGEIRTVNRDSADQADKDLYWAVLGGSPGAFGVTTNLVFHPILDKDYPQSTAFSSTVFHSDKRMEAVIEILEDFINRAHESDENPIADGLDLMMSLSSNNGNRLNPNLDPNKDSIIPNLDMILFELECRDKTDEKAYAQFNEIVGKFKENVYHGFARGLPGGYNGRSHYKLSELSLGFVRKPPAVTSTGRENRKPYRKACYGSVDKVKPGWSQAFSKLLNDVVATEDDISCVFQVVVGGGAQTRFGEANLNSVAHRDAQLHGIVFDLFRGEDDDSIKAADEFSKRFEIDVVNKYQTAYPKVMAQWASHGDLDMSKKSVWEKYIDNPVTYNRLRKIKKDVDPNDVFHSRFTIPPAE